MKYNGIELEPITEPQIFDPPKFRAKAPAAKLGLYAFQYDDLQGVCRSKRKFRTN